MAALNERDFTFSAIATINGSDVAAPLRIAQADENSDKYLQKVWHRLSQAVTCHHELSNNQVGCPSWAKWKPHEWCKQSIPDRQQFVGWNGQILAGFLNLRKDFPSHYVASKAILYVEHIAAFPGNLSPEIWNRKLRFVGVPLLAYAVFQSMLQDGDGTVGLHVDGGAIRFYEQLPGIVGFPIFHPSKYNVDGPQPIGEHARTQVYLEMTSEAAARFLELHRNV